MAIEYIKRVLQSTPAAGTGTYALAVTSSPTAGNLVVLYGRGGGGTVFSSVSDSKGNTWTIDHGTGNSTTNATVSIASSLLTSTLTTSDTITVVYTGAATANRTMVAHEFSGVHPTSKIDVVSTISTANATAVTTATAGPTPTLTTNGSLVFAAIGTSASNTYTPSVGYTAANATVASFSGGAYQIATDQTAKSITWTWGTLAAYGAGIVVYRPAVSSNLLLLGVG
jgi:hypothetical protein